MPPCACSHETRARSDGAGERAAHVAEHLRFDQLVGEGSAVDRRERPVAAGAEPMEGACDQLLPGAALAFNQHGKRRRRGPPDGLARRGNGGAPAENLGRFDMRLARQRQRVEPGAKRRRNERRERLHGGFERDARLGTPARHDAANQDAAVPNLRPDGRDRASLSSHRGGHRRLELEQVGGRPAVRGQEFRSVRVDDADAIGGCVASHPRAAARERRQFVVGILNELHQRRQSMDQVHVLVSHSPPEHPFRADATNPCAERRARTIALTRGAQPVEQQRVERRRADVTACEDEPGA